MTIEHLAISRSSTMPRDRKIDYLELHADDFSAVRTFYEDTFGWTFTEYGPDYLAFTDNKIDGGFFRSPLKSVQSSGAVLIVLFADDLEQTRRKVVENGGRISKDIFSFPGGRRFHFLDSHGNELAAWSVPQAE